MLRRTPARKCINVFLSESPRCRKFRGNALVEFSLIVPLLFLLIVNTANFGGFFFAWITVANAARAGADYWAMGTGSLGAPAQPTAAQVTAVVTQEVSSLLNRASLVVTVCKNLNGVHNCGYVPPNDPEPASFTLGAVDVTYTYKPLIPAFNFTALNIHVGFFPAAGTAIHRRAVMRILQ